MFFFKINTFTLWCMVIPSWFTFILHLVRGPKAMYIEFMRNQTMEVRPSSRTMEKAPLYGPQCKPALITIIFVAWRKLGGIQHAC